MIQQVCDWINQRIGGKLELDQLAEWVSKSKAPHLAPCGKEKSLGYFDIQAQGTKSTTLDLWCKAFKHILCNAPYKEKVSDTTIRVYYWFTIQHRAQPVNWHSILSKKALDDPSNNERLKFYTACNAVKTFAGRLNHAMRCIHARIKDKQPCPKVSCEPFDGRVPLPFNNVSVEELPERFGKLSKAEILWEKINPSDMSIDYSQAFIKHILEEKASELGGLTKSLYRHGDSEARTAFRVVWHIVKTTFSIPTLHQVRQFYQETKLAALHGVDMKFDSVWIDAVLDAIEKIEGEWDQDKAIKDASHYDVGKWLYILRTTIKKEELKELGLIYNEVDVVLGLITQACMSDKYNGVCVRDWMEKWAEDNFEHIGKKLHPKKIPSITELLIKYDLIAIKRKAAPNVPAIYGLAKKHPLYKTYLSREDRVCVK